MDLLHSLLAVLCGALVGFTLGLIGGGGLITATPLLLYVVGLQPHVAISTGALAVSVNAFANFGGQARAGNVRWRCAVIGGFTMTRHLPSQNSPTSYWAARQKPKSFFG